VKNVTNLVMMTGIAALFKQILMGMRNFSVIAVINANKNALMIFRN